MHRYFVTGTDTDIGKTRVAAALALALRRAGLAPTLVKLVQTGLPPQASGDAAHAGALAGVAHRELARYERAADPWSAALAAGQEPRTAAQLAAALATIAGPLVAEGSGGIMAPLRPGEDLADVAALAGLATIVAVGMRLGCLNHTLLTLAQCRRRRLAVAGAVLVERWGATEAAYRADVLRVLRPQVRILGMLSYAAAERESVECGAKLFEPVVKHGA